MYNYYMMCEIYIVDTIVFFVENISNLFCYNYVYLILLRGVRISLSHIKSFDNNLNKSILFISIIYELIQFLKV